MFFALQLDRGNISQALADNLLGTALLMILVLQSFYVSEKAKYNY